MNVKVNGRPIDAHREGRVAPPQSPPGPANRTGSAGAGQTCAVVAPSKARTVGDLLDGLRQAGHLPAGQVVTRLDLDGRRWPEPGTENPRDVSLRSVTDVAVETSGARGYAKIVLADLPGALDTLVQGATTTARSFGVGSIPHANRNLHLLLDAVQGFLACLYQVHNTCDLPGHPLGRNPTTLRRLHATLEGIEQSQTREDWGALVRQIGEELPATLGEFSAVIAHISAGVDRAPQR